MQVKLQQPTSGRFFVTIPLPFIKEMRLMKGDIFEVILENNRIIITPVVKYGDKFK